MLVLLKERGGWGGGVQARLYDRFALAYHGGPDVADTNFPPTEEMLEQLGQKVMDS